MPHRDPQDESLHLLEPQDAVHHKVVAEAQVVDVSVAVVEGSFAVVEDSFAGGVVTTVVGAPAISENSSFVSVAVSKASILTSPDTTSATDA